MSYFKFKPGFDVDKFVHDRDSMLDKRELRYETIEMRKESTGRLFNDMGKFMSLVGFVALLLGCVGVASAIQIYIREKTATIAVMRCMGVTVVKAFMIYLIQILVIGLLGSLAGALIGVGVQQILPWVMKDLLPMAVHTRVSWMAIGQGIALGLVIAFIFGLLPLLSIRRITPLYSLRSSYEDHPVTSDPWRWPVFGLMVLFIAVFTHIQLDDWKATAFFTGGLLAAYGLLTLVARGLMTALRSVTRGSWSFQVRQGFANLYRPNNQTVILVVAIGLSTALLCVLFFIQSIIVHQLVISGARSQANMVLYDIQSGQVRPLDSLTRAQGLPILDTVPIVSVRMVPQSGNATAAPAEDEASRPGTRRREEDSSTQRPRRRRRFDDELRVTYRNHLTGTETITEGEWIGEALPGKPVPVSLEDGYARRQGFHVGDTIAFNVQGLPLTAVVASLRKVEWNRLQTNFRVVFPTGVLEAAPQFHVLLTRTASTEKSVRYQQAVVKRFPTVSIIDLSLILSVLDALIDKINYVIHFMAAFSIVTGLIVLIASVRNSKYQRIQESVLLRTLGASRKQVFGINALEYLFLGLLAGLTGGLISVAGAWLIAHYLFKLPFVVDYLPAVVLLGLVSLLTMIVGLLNSRGLLNRSTLEVLRSEVV
jgi:putative ABC transport system permease protein